MIKEEGKANDLLARLAADSAFAGVDFAAATDASRFVGRAPEQVDEFLAEVVEPIRKKYAAALSGDAEVRV